MLGAFPDADNFLVDLKDLRRCLPDGCTVADADLEQSLRVLRRAGFAWLSVLYKGEDKVLAVAVRGRHILASQLNAAADVEGG